VQIPDFLSDSPSIFPWGDARRWNAYTARQRAREGGRWQKLSVDAGFTCPNRDGKVGRGGCTFCSNEAFNPGYCQPEKSITQQLQEGITFHRNRYRRADAYIAYFQAYSNTYAPLSVLKTRYEEALQVDGVRGLAIATRPDCIDEEILDYLKHLAKQHPISLELGIESLYNKTLQRIRRGHDAQCTEQAIRVAAAAGLPPTVHLILGLPGESREEILAEAGMISALPIGALKLHQLQIFRNTAMEKEFLEKPQDFRLLDLNEYATLLIDFLEQLRPDIPIVRLAAEAPPRFLRTQNLGGLRYDQIMQVIEKEMEDRNTWQGRLYTFAGK
jgi:hypothetical protein